MGSLNDTRNIWMADPLDCFNLSRSNFVDGYQDRENFLYRRVI